MNKKISKTINFNNTFIIAIEVRFLWTRLRLFSGNKYLRQRSQRAVVQARDAPIHLCLLPPLLQRSWPFPAPSPP